MLNWPGWKGKLRQLWEVWFGTLNVSIYIQMHKFAQVTTYSFSKKKIIRHSLTKN